MKINSAKFIALLSVLSTVLWVVGLAWTINNYFFSKSDSAIKSDTSDIAEVNDSGDYQIIALGDSLTRGTGDQSGKGYVGYLMDDLKGKTKQDIRLSNLAIKGQVSAQVVEQLQKPEIKRQVSTADAVVMTIGGNDLFQGGRALENLSSAENDQVKARYLENLDKIIQEIRNANPEAMIYHVGLYNPFNDLDDAKTTSAIVRQWNFESAEIAAGYPKVIMVPVFDLFEQNVNNYLFSDKFHPNSEGYKLIGERLSSLIVFSEEGNQDD
ncbi:GDSL-type esterase/lipase family protein [Metabacillus idriensis]|uniref:GDSL-type esterase/lipase family protein n=1 Tax=Metabacillus idriensis TaxID=324768 RepID=UPI001639B812|nr:GDSL-type esterase/lipase family protein [Metabacillus idriensis]QNG60426.1 GDSL family lipase [Bacillus sp. PAMC26568]